MQAPDVIGSMQGLVGPVSVFFLKESETSPAPTIGTQGLSLEGPFFFSLLPPPPSPFFHFQSILGPSVVIFPFPPLFFLLFYFYFYFFLSFFLSFFGLCLFFSFLSISDIQRNYLHNLLFACYYVLVVTQLLISTYCDVPQLDLFFIKCFTLHCDFW